MRKKIYTGLVCMSLAAVLAGCGQSAGTTATTAATTEAATEAEKKTEATAIEGAVNVVLSDDGITVDGEAASENTEAAV